MGLQVGRDSGCGALAKCLVELREYGSRPGFSVTSSSTCNAVSTWLTQGKGLLVMNSVCPRVRASPRLVVTHR